MLLTLGAQVICMPGTGRVVMYMVTQRYRYKVPIRKKNRLLAIDLQKKVRVIFRQLQKCCGSVVMPHKVAKIYLNLPNSGNYLAQCCINRTPSQLIKFHYLVS